MATRFQGTLLRAQDEFRVDLPQLSTLSTNPHSQKGEKSAVGQRKPIKLHCMDRLVHHTAREPWNVLILKVGTAPKPKRKAKHPYKVMVWAGISKKGATNICLLTLNSTAEIKHIVNAYIGAVISLSSLPFPPTSICLLLFVEVVVSPLCCADTCLFL